MAKKKPIVTNAMRMLKSAGVPYEAVEYEASEEMLASNHFGSYISQLTGIPPECSFKTLVARGEKKGVLVCCIPVNDEVDLKKLAKAAGEKKVELIHVKEILALTGYIRGGVSPLGMKKKYPTYLHKTCMDFEQDAVSAGVCGCTLLLKPEDLIRVTDGIVCDIIAE